MSTTTREWFYNCSEDCQQSGCMGHTARMEYQSTASILTFDTGNGQRIFLDSNQLDAFLAMLASIGKHRCEIERNLRNVRG